MVSNYITGNVPSSGYTPYYAAGQVSPAVSAQSISRLPPPDLSWKPGQSVLNKPWTPPVVMADPDFESSDLKDHWLYNILEDHLSDKSDSNKSVDESSAIKTNRVASSVPQSVIDYLNADLAKYYGMSKETAYQEALSNTAYQRAVKDMQAAGLNPASIFGSGKGFTAGGVSYVSSADSPSSGGFAYGGRSSKDKMFSAGTYFGVSTAAGIATMALMKNPIGFWIGKQTAEGVMGAMNQISKYK